MIAIAPEGVGSEADVALAESTSNRGAPHVSFIAKEVTISVGGLQRLEFGDTQVAGERLTFKKSSIPTQWDDSLQNEFEDLVDKKIDDLLDRKGEGRLQELQHWRRTLKAPRTAEQIINEEQTYRRLNELVSALNRCAEIIKKQD